MEKNQLNHFAAHPPETRQHCESTILQVLFFFKDIVQENEESGREARLILGNAEVGRIREKMGKGERNSLCDRW